MVTMSATTKKLSDLSPNPRNPRKITEKKQKMLLKSLNEFGDLSGFVWNRQTGRLVGGHQRQTVLPADASVIFEKRWSTPTKLGTTATGFVDIEGERFAFREVDWGPEKEKAANIAANQHSGDWDLGLLAEDLLSLDAINLDMDLTGFDESEIEGIMAPTREPDPKKDPEFKDANLKTCPNCGALIDGNT